MCLLGALAVACSSTNQVASPSGGAGGGTVSTGGTATGGVATGGGMGTGGAIGSGGTATSSGGDRGNGGAMTGGSVTGGSATGGTGTSATATEGRGEGGSGGGGGAGGRATGGSAGGATGGASTVVTASGGTSGSTGVTTALATGGAATGGSSGSTTGGSSGSGPFVLAWQDDFNALDTSLWQAQSFTWDGNQAQFTPQNVSVANGKLNLALTAAPSGSAKPYLGVELRSTKTLTYGKVSASMRFAAGSGIVSGLVLFYTPYPNCNWNEIDIEHLGNSATSSQLNCMVFKGTVVPNCTASVTPTQEPQVVSLGGNAETAFHQYDIEWTPAGVKFYVDGVLLRTWTTSIALLNQSLNILLTIWASNASSWAGALEATSAPTSAEVDWIKVYSWKG